MTAGAVPGPEGFVVPEPRHVLYLVSAPFVGGGENSLLAVLAHLSRRWEPVVAVPSEGEMARRVREAGVDVRVLRVRSPNLHRWWNPMATLRRVAALAAEVDASLIHVNSLPYVYAGVHAGGRTRTPVLCHVRDLVEPAWIASVRRKAVREGVRLWLAITDHCARPFREAALPVEVLHNGVDLEALGGSDGAALRREWGLEGRQVVGVLGYVIPRKGHEVFVEAGMALAERVPEARFLVVGDDPFPARGFLEGLRARVLQVGLAERFIFTGFRRDVGAVLRAMDVLAMPSWEEPFGRVLIEAMAAGTPVVATRAGGVPEAVTDGVDALLVPPREPRALAEALERLLGDPALRGRLAEAGQRTVRERFDVRVTAARLDAIYG
ncbi:MAG: glycosyltransferase family 4 protein, partial [Planctomycetes bacterium]|nr:glycosyltransferase family 4 protein [Planctomycetota bacterium]